MEILVVFDGTAVFVGCVRNREDACESVYGSTAETFFVIFSLIRARKNVYVMSLRIP